MIINFLRKSLQKVLGQSHYHDIQLHGMVFSSSDPHPKYNVVHIMPIIVLRHSQCHFNIEIGGRGIFFKVYLNFQLNGYLSQDFLQGLSEKRSE